MPRIWADTMDAHRRQVHDAILDATAELVVEHGPLSVAMSAIAERAGIGRATLYKYFPDVESILVTWHRREFAEQLERMRALSERADITLEHLREFVRAHRRHHAHGKTAVVGTLAHSIAHSDSTIADTIEADIVDILAGVVRGLARRDEVRTDYSPDVLALWILHSVHAPSDFDDAAVAELLVDSIAPRSRQRLRSARDVTA